MIEPRCSDCGELLTSGTLHLRPRGVASYKICTSCDTFIEWKSTQPSIEEQLQRFVRYMISKAHPDEAVIGGEGETNMHEVWSGTL